MPFYSFKNKDTEEVLKVFLKISELDSYKSNNPNLEKIIEAPGFMDPVRAGRIKPSSGFRDVLDKVKSNNIGSKINTFK